MNTYKVYHLNKFCKSFSSRDAAMTYILNQNSDAGNYEILDGSDEL